MGRIGGSVMKTMRLRGERRLIAGCALLLAGLCASSEAAAQAWLPEKGSLDFALDLTSVLNKKHYTSAGVEVDAGHTDQQIVTVGASYSPADRWLVNSSLGFVNARYRGLGLGGHDTEIDDGSWHGTVTDLQLSVHFQVSDGPIAFAPYVGVVMPTNSYETFGHSAPGRSLEEYWIGFYTARALHEWIPRTYVQLRGNYALVEKVADVSHNRTNVGLEIGYFLNESLSARLLASRQWTHGGVHIPLPLTDPLFPYHDRLAEDEFVNVGAGLGWSVNERLGIYGLYMQGIDGRNSHKVEHRVSLGMTWGSGSH